MFVYRLWPIDEWDGWTPFVARDERDMLEFAEFCYLAARLGWQGDIREGEGPFVTMLLDKRGPITRALAFKQDHCGVTFVATTYGHADWLMDEYGCDSFVRWDQQSGHPPPVVVTQATLPAAIAVTRASSPKA